ncbi:MAG: ATP-binding cassette domain-containing protein [Chitinophagaceae bacterium]
MAILTLQNISKFYGRIQALNNVSFEVPKGAVFGILGPNGSGKTTLLGIVMDVLKANSGSFLWFGQLANNAQRKQIGTLLETPNFYHYLSGERNLLISAAIKNRGKEDIAGALEKVKLTQRRHSKFSTYSLGMKQRLALASALLGNPSVLVLDEPTNGLDPVGIAETRELIRSLAKEGKTIILASHLLDEVEKVCTHVAILQKGKLITSGHVDDVLVNEDIIEVSSSDNQNLLSLLKNFPGSKSVKSFENHVQLVFSNGLANLEQVNKFCFDHGIVLNHLQLKKKSLESKFFELTNTSEANN